MAFVEFQTLVVILECLSLTHVPFFVQNDDR